MKVKKLGVLGKKIGMTQLFLNGKQVGVTVIDYSGMEYIGDRNIEKDGYSAAIIGYEVEKVTRNDKEIKQVKHLKEFRIDDITVYQEENFNKIIQDIKKVDVTAYMKGRGFAGSIKRHGFGGGPATHGSKHHRRTGSVGMHSFPGRVFKGKKMPGHYGDTKVTILSQNLVRVDIENKLLFIEGSVPGSKGKYVLVRDSVKG